MSAFETGGAIGPTGPAGLTIGHSADVPPASANALDDEFTDSSLDGKWSWRNQGGASWAEFEGWGELTAPQSTRNVRGLEQTVAGNFDVRCKLVFLLPNFADFRMAGLYAGNNSSGKLVSLNWLSYAAGNQWSLQMYRWDSATVINAALSELVVGTAGLAKFLSVLYFRLVSDGTNLTGYVSLDGRYWYSRAAWIEPLATHISSIDRVGIFVDNEEAAGGSVVASFEWFRKT